jgi:hypothetical protein
MKTQIILLLFSNFFLVSCGQINKLSKEDYKWIPYEGNETLIFKSNTGERDTIFLLKKDTTLAYPEAQSVNGIKYEVVSIICKHSDYKMPSGTHAYITNIFFQVGKAKDNRTEINILLSAKDAKFYRLSSIKVDSLSKENPSVLQTQYGRYSDVYIINGEDYLGNLHQRSNFITKVYWSKSNGLIRYEKNDTVYWELSKD